MPAKTPTRALRASSTAKPKRQHHRPARVVTDDPWFEGKVTAVAMSRVLGTHINNLNRWVCEEKIPCTVIAEVRWYDVDAVLERVLLVRLPVSPLHQKDVSYAKDAAWAWDAFGLQPWNCRLAPSGRAWRLYLEAKSNGRIREQLAKISLDLAGRELGELMTREKRKALDAVAKARKDKEKEESLTDFQQSPAGRGEGEDGSEAEVDDDVLKPTQAELAMANLDPDQLQAPLTVETDY
jgi:hypothetical protein